MGTVDKLQISGVKFEDASHRSEHKILGCNRFANFEFKELIFGSLRGTGALGTKA